MDSSTLRIIDANINRTREALRVIEDFARLQCDDAHSAQQVKHCRHAVRDIVEQLGGADMLLAERDIVNDVGTNIKTPGELSRESVDDVVRAAFVRAQEATRTIGEYAKLISPDAAHIAETLRYQLYELDQRLMLRSRRRQMFAKVKLYVLITESLCHQDWLKTAELAILGGTGCIQLREKSLDDGELLRRAQQLRELTAQHDVLFFVNDRPDIARLSKADGVHVGQGDLSISQIRRIAGGNMLVGKSTHTIEQFQAALSEEPDYLAVGPMFDTATKPQDHIAGVETLERVRKMTDLPIVAIGGITATNAQSIFVGGANAVSVCSAVISTDDPQAAANAFLS